MKLTKSFRRILLKVQLLPFSLGLGNSPLRTLNSELPEFINIDEGTYENGRKSYLPDVVTDGTINDGSYVKCGASGIAIAVIPTDCTSANGDVITIIPMAPAKYSF